LVVLIKAQGYRLSNAEGLLSGKKRVRQVSKPEPMIKTELGIIPGNWKVSKLKEIITEARLGGNYSNSVNENGIPLIKMGNLGRGNISLENLQFIPSKLLYNESNQRFINT
jgi:hypothetical protein